MTDDEHAAGGPPGVCQWCELPMTTEHLDAVDCRKALMAREDRSFSEGNRAAYRAILGQAVIGLIGNGEQPEAGILRMQLEDARAALRQLCERYGDNDWPDDLALADVIRKHLEPHLDEAFEDDA